MSNLRAYVLAVGGGFGAAAAVTGVATAYPKLALGLLGASAFLLGLGTNLPQPKPPA